MIVIGDRATFAAEIGGARSPRLRNVDLWAGGKCLTSYDNEFYVPSFLAQLRSTAAEAHQVPPCPFPGRPPQEIFELLLADDETGLREQFWLLNWLDHVTTYTYLDGGELVIAFAFWGELNRTFVARVEPEQLATSLERAADLLDEATAPGNNP